MRGAVAVGLVLIGGALWLVGSKRGRCLLRRRHDAARHPLGGFRCQDCGKAFSGLDDAGLLDGDHVSPLRRVYDRDGGSLTRTTAFEPTKGRGW